MEAIGETAVVTDTELTATVPRFVHVLREVPIVRAAVLWLAGAPRLRYSRKAARSKVNASYTGSERREGERETESTCLNKDSSLGLQKCRPGEPQPNVINAREDYLKKKERGGGGKDKELLREVVRERRESVKQIGNQERDCTCKGGRREPSRVQEE